MHSFERKPLEMKNDFFRSKTDKKNCQMDYCFLFNPIYYGYNNVTSFQHNKKRRQKIIYFSLEKIIFSHVLENMSLLNKKHKRNNKIIISIAFSYGIIYLFFSN